MRSGKSISSDPIMRIAYCPTSAKFINSPYFRSRLFFGFPYFDHDALTHHAKHVHVLDAPEFDDDKDDDV